MAPQCGIRVFLNSASYRSAGHLVTRNYREFRVGLGDEIGFRRPNDSASGEAGIERHTAIFSPRFKPGEAAAAHRRRYVIEEVSPRFRSG